MAKKTTGEIGFTRVTAGPEGTTVELISTDLPSNKEELEFYFCQRFIDAFNATRPLGPTVSIESPEQMDTSDLDFRIKCAAADYIEEAELNPRSEEFGRTAHRTGKLNVYEYAKWIYMRVIKKKMLKYGTDLSGRVILLLYVTHWQFLPSQSVIDCVRAIIAKDGCTFAAVFLLLTDGKELKVTEQLHPFNGLLPHKPAAYKGITLTNLEPGNISWKVPMTE